MRRLRLADRSFLVGDAAADLLVDYAAALGRRQSADRIDLRVLGSDGRELLATFLLNAGVTLVSEPTDSDLPEPDNAEACEHMRTRLLRLTGARRSDPEDTAGEAIWNDPRRHARP